MGADTCHHGGSLRPTEYLPLPSELTPSPFPSHVHGHAHKGMITCPGALFEAIHPKKSRTEPYYDQMTTAPDRDVPKAQDSLTKMADFDASEDVFVVIAHDASLLDVVEFFPKSANAWKEKGWKERGHWRFLGDFGEAASRVSSL